MFNTLYRRTWFLRFLPVWYVTHRLKRRKRLEGWRDDEYYQRMYAIPALRHETLGDKLASVRDSVTHEIARDKSSARILDLATGRGYQARNISAHGYHKLYACDVLLGRTVQARNLNSDTSIQFAVVDMRCLAFRDGICDAITISGALHDLTPQEIEDCLRECHRVLRIGGRLIILEPRCLQDIRGLFRRKMYEIGCNLLDESVNMRDFLRAGITTCAAMLGFTLVRRQTCWHSILCVYTFERGAPAPHEARTNTPGTLRHGALLE